MGYRGFYGIYHSQDLLHFFVNRGRFSEQWSAKVLKSLGNQKTGLELALLKHKQGFRWAGTM